MSGDTNAVVDVFVKNLQTGATVRVSVNTYGQQANAASHNPGISADGRYLAFDSPASNLVADDMGGTDVFRVSLFATERGSWRNESTWYDVTADGAVVPLDALVVINELNRPAYSDPSSAQLYLRSEPSAPYYDVNGDNFCTPIDALFIVNYLNGTGSGRALEAERGLGGEGEAVWLIAGPGRQQVMWSGLGRRSVWGTAELGDTRPPDAIEVQPWIRQFARAGMLSGDGTQRSIAVVPDDGPEAVDSLIPGAIESTWAEAACDRLRRRSACGNLLAAQTARPFPGRLFGRTTKGGWQNEGRGGGY